MGACGADGAMGATLDHVFTDIKNDTCVVDLPKPGVTSITPDDKSNPIAVLLDDSSVQKKISFSTYNCDLSKFPNLFGGTYDSTTKKWSAPTAMGLICQSVEITTKDIDGNHTVGTAPKCAVVAGYTGNYNKKGVAEIAVELYVLVPQDASGNDLAPFAMQAVAAS